MNSILYYNEKKWAYNQVTLKTIYKSKVPHSSFKVLISFKRHQIIKDVFEKLAWYSISPQADDWIKWSSGHILCRCHWNLVSKMMKVCCYFSNLYFQEKYFISLHMVHSQGCFHQNEIKPRVCSWWAWPCTVQSFTNDLKYWIDLEQFRNQMFWNSDVHWLMNHYGHQTFRNLKWLCQTEGPFQPCLPIHALLNFLKIHRTEQNFTGHVLQSCGFRYGYY